ncbi:hypothetical protein [Rhizobium sp. MHM7A]|uniref:hypothetical protein n=1 Tax=Rhizobium sp. MHM7A TaxID=2583233 RepID=UPI0011067E15|nr:hypothetical protein [Rhizobium sp. MHM7A]TLX14481.1 hypothetical protein FFR93_12080 [Rhizobium sp. MHM7A]
MSKIREDRIDGGMIAYYVEDNPPLTDGFCAMAEKNFPDDAFLTQRQRDDVAPIERNAPPRSSSPGGGSIWPSSLASIFSSTWPLNAARVGWSSSRNEPATPVLDYR